MDMSYVWMTTGSFRASKCMMANKHHWGNRGKAETAIKVKYIKHSMTKSTQMQKTDN